MVSIGKGLQPKRMEICAQLWARHIRAEFGYKANTNLKEALAYADDNGIPYVVLFGESELASQSVKVSICNDTRHSSYTVMSGLYNLPRA